jgi:hypothetical protein
MQGDATGSTGSVQHGIARAETQHTNDETGLPAADIVGLEPELVLHHFNPGRSRLVADRGRVPSTGQAGHAGGAVQGDPEGAGGGRSNAVRRTLFPVRDLSWSTQPIEEAGHTAANSAPVLATSHGSLGITSPSRRMRSGCALTIRNGTTRSPRCRVLSNKGAAQRGCR